MIWLGNFWKQSEFDCPCCGTGGDKMDPVLIEILDEVRKQVGVALTSNSAYRCPKHNSSPAVGSTSGSYHLKGQAADITYARRGLRNRVNILRLFVLSENIGRKHGGLGLGLYPSFSHVDTRTASGSGISPARWSTFAWPRLK